MASTLDRFFRTDFSVTTRLLVYAAPVAADSTVCINSMILTNTHATNAITVTIEALAQGKSGETADTDYVTVKKDWSIPAGETRTWEGVLNLVGYATDSDEVYISSSADTLHVWGSPLLVD